MALIFSEGFEQYNTASDLAYGRYMTGTALACKWNYLYSQSAQTFIDTSYRTAQPAGTAKSLKIAATTSWATGAVLQLNNPTTVIVGFAFYASQLTGWYMRLGSPSNGSWTGGTYLSVYPNASGQLILMNNRTGITLISSPINTVMVGVWYYVEVKVTFGSSSSAELRVDGLSMGTASSVDTRPHTSDSVFSQILWAFPTAPGVNSTVWVDDIYVCDSTGTTNNDFLGPVSIYTLFPTSNGGTNQFTPTGVASNWDAVNEQSYDTTTYVESSTLNHVDRYNVTDLAGSPSSIFAVGVGSIAQKTENTARQYRNTVTVSGTTANGGTATPVLSTYLNNQDIFQTAPSGSAWTVSDVNSMEIGVEVL